MVTKAEKLAKEAIAKAISHVWYAGIVEHGWMERMAEVAWERLVAQGVRTQDDARRELMPMATDATISGVIRWLREGGEETEDDNFKDGITKACMRAVATHLEKQKAAMVDHIARQGMVNHG
ncbi:MAG: hypothetical protein Q8R28_15390 [Dehalococcoidia bacterium]|nr:hypothetical protein [Dehalococcoidia bacterium]